MIYRALERGNVGLLHRLGLGALALLLTSTLLLAQASNPPRTIFDDDPNAPGVVPPQPGVPPAPGIVAPAAGLVPGLIDVIYDNVVASGKVRENHISPGLGFNLNGQAAAGFIPMSFLVRGMINIPAGGLHGAFQVESSGDSDVTIDNAVIAQIRREDPANTFEREVNYLEGLHTLNVTMYHLHSTGIPQGLRLLWKPAGGQPIQIPAAWCWHAKVDEPAGVAALAVMPAPPVGAAGNAGNSNWIPAGTPRPANANGQPGDILPNIVLEQYRGPDFSPLNRWTTRNYAAVNINVLQNHLIGGLYSSSYKFRGMLKVDVDSQYIFNVSGNIQLRITVDDQLVNRAGFANEALIRQPINLKAGYHKLEVDLGQLALTLGHNSLALSSSVNNAPYAPIPASALCHARSQERWGDSVAGAVPAAVPSALTPAPIIVKKLPIPDAAAQAKATAQLRMKYGAGWVDPGTAQQADYLIKASEQTRDDAVGSFVLLQKAYQQATTAAAVSRAFQAIDLLASQYTVDAVRLKLSVLQSLGGKRITDATAIGAAASVFDQAMKEDNYAVASDAATMSLADAKLRNQPTEIAAAEQRLRSATAANAELQKIKPLQMKLSESPNDPTANLAIGKFYCFISRNWSRGTPALARSADPVLSWLGRHEGMAVSTAPAQLALANAWWDAAETQPKDVADVMRERAAQWYAVAIPNLAGLSRKVAQKRFAKIATAAKLPSPLMDPPTAYVGGVPSAAPAASSPAGSYVPPPPVARAPAPQPAAAPPPVQAPNTGGLARKPGPLLIVCDRATITARRKFSVLSSIKFQAQLTEQTSPMSVIIADSPPVTISGLARDFENGGAMTAQLEAAMNATPAASNILSGLAVGMRGKPARLWMMLDGATPLDPLAALLQQMDPKKSAQRYVHVWYADRTTQEQGMNTAMHVLGCLSASSNSDQ